MISRSQQHDERSLTVVMLLGLYGWPTSDDAYHGHPLAPPSAAVGGSVSPAAPPVAAAIDAAGPGTVDAHRRYKHTRPRQSAAPVRDIQA